MSRKPRFKVQRRNTYDHQDVRLNGNKQWLPVWDDNQRLGYTLTFEEATVLYWQMSERWPGLVYRIVEKR